jgi:thiamine biosynthesis protein ThiS
VEITLNGEPRVMPDGSTVADLVRALDLENKRIAVELNREIVGRGRFGEQRLAGGDVVEIVHFVGGG